VCRSEQQHVPSLSGGVVFGLGRCVFPRTTIRRGAACALTCDGDGDVLEDGLWFAWLRFD
jgi:hypothetical protein